MAHVESGGGKGRRTTLELNLVPFIDLMSVLITFLLITAVWTQVSMIQIGTSIYGKRTDKPNVIPPQADVVLRIDVKPNGYTIVLGRRVTTIPLLNGEYDEDRMVEELQKAKAAYPEKQDAAIAMSDELPYERLIKGMDNTLKAGFSQISVLTGGP